MTTTTFAAALTVAIAFAVGPTSVAAQSGYDLFQKALATEAKARLMALAAPTGSLAVRDLKANTSRILAQGSGVSSMVWAFENFLPKATAKP